jgi:F-type H+-transporting ATPase subunit delta
MKNTRVARRYASALMSIAVETKTVDRVADDLKGIDATIRGSRQLRIFLESPVISRPRKKAVVKELFGVSVAAPVVAFVNFLVDKQREAHLPGIIEQFLLMRDEQLGIVAAEVVSAIDLSPAQETALVRQLRQYTRKDVRLETHRDPSIRGGIIVRIGDTVLDASVRRQLERLREQFIAGETPAT